MTHPHTEALGRSRSVSRRYMIPSVRQLNQLLLVSRCRFHASSVHYYNNFPSLVCLSLLLAMCSRVFLLVPPCGHKPPRTLHDRLNSHPCLERHRFPVPRYDKLLDIALYAIYPLFLLPTPCPLRTTPSRLPETISFRNRPLLNRERAPPPTTIISCARLFKCSYMHLSRGRGTVQRVLPDLWCYVHLKYVPGTCQPTSKVDFDQIVCVCVVIPFILDVRVVDAPGGVTQEEGLTGFSPPSFCGVWLNYIA